MCPACLTTAALAAASLSSAGGLTALVPGKLGAGASAFLRDPFMAWLRFHDRYVDAA